MELIKYQNRKYVICFFVSFSSFNIDLLNDLFVNNFIQKLQFHSKILYSFKKLYFPSNNVKFVCVGVTGQSRDSFGFLLIVWFAINPGDHEKLHSFFTSIT